MASTGDSFTGRASLSSLKFKVAVYLLGAFLVAVLQRVHLESGAATPRRPA
jgi:hypothetical protein